jgi:hypothetical protein
MLYNISVGTALQRRSSSQLVDLFAGAPAYFVGAGIGKLWQTKL